MGRQLSFHERNIGWIGMTEIFRRGSGNGKTTARLVRGLYACLYDLVGEQIEQCFAVLEDGSIEIDQFCDSLRHCIRDARNCDAAKAVSDKHDIRQVFPGQMVDNVINEYGQRDRLRQKV